MFNFFSSPSYLVKFCRPEHNILNRCHTIRFGTLEYYRELESKLLIADKEEGRESTDIVSVDSTNASPQVKEMFPILKGANVTIQYCKSIITAQNCWIWCCSLIPQSTNDDELASKGKEFDDGYTSWFGITNRFHFAERLNDLLANSITVRDVVAESHKKLIENFTIREMNEIRVACHHNVVEYTDKKAHIVDKGQVKNYSDSKLSDFLRPIFIKPKTFAHNNEYRFAFWLQHPLHGIIPVQKDPIDLPIFPISEYQSLNKL
ncbi:MAG: hypothetical protein KC590_06985 [Nitrospira sp.]|nr:hypothetical protein [Nitrospira sp.]